MIEAACAEELKSERFQGYRQQAEQTLAAGRLDRAAGVGQAAAHAPCGRCRLGRPDQGTRLVERLGLVQRAGQQGLRLVMLAAEHLRETAEHPDHEAVARGRGGNIRRAIAEPDHGHQIRRVRRVSSVLSSAARKNAVAADACPARSCARRAEASSAAATSSSPVSVASAWCQTRRSACSPPVNAPASAAWTRWRWLSVAP